MDGLHHQLQGWIDNRAGDFGVKVTRQGGKAREIGKQGGDRLAFAVRDTPRFQRGLLGADALGQVWRDVARRCWGLRGGADRCRNPGGFLAPDQSPPVHVSNLGMSEQQLFLQVCETRLIEGEPPLYAPVGDPLFLLEQFQHLLEHFIKRHGRPSERLVGAFIEGLSWWQCYLFSTSWSARAPARWGRRPHMVSTTRNSASPLIIRA